MIGMGLVGAHGLFAGLIASYGEVFCTDLLPLPNVDVFGTSGLAQ
jgi:hypothetical protein